MHNKNVRKELLDASMKNYELADLMGITEFTLSRKLRKELSEDEQQEIIMLIRQNTKAV